MKILMVCEWNIVLHFCKENLQPLERKKQAEASWHVEREGKEGFYRRSVETIHDNFVLICSGGLYPPHRFERQ